MIDECLFGVLLSVGLAFTSQISLTPIICKWFVHRRGQALFYLSTGSMAGIAIMNPISNILMNTFSWQNTILIFGVGFIANVLVVTTFQLYSVAIIADLAWAGNVALSSAILSELYGVKLIGILYGLTFFVHQIGATISTLLGGWAYETYGTHLIAFGSAGIFLFIASFASLKIPNFIRKFTVSIQKATASQHGK